jgi:hypothetical protein
VKGSTQTSIVNAAAREDMIVEQLKALKLLALAAE